MAKKLPDLSGYDRDSLLALQSEIQTQLAARAEQEKADAIKALADLAAERGFSLDELVKGGKAKKAKTKGVAKYRNPANASQTWTGKGRKPSWFVDALASGKSAKDLEV